jgi:3-hydroxyacyl-[acyl-carrier-protein] dehydratase
MSHEDRGLPAPSAILPHRPPFLFVDNIVELVPGRRAVACWTPLPTADWFGGHFPDQPVLPGVLLVEAMAQTGALAVLSDPAYRNSLPLFGGIDRTRFRRTVRPGETVRMEVSLAQMRSRAGRGDALAWVGDQLAAEARLTFLLVPKDRNAGIAAAPRQDLSECLGGKR